MSIGPPNTGGPILKKGPPPRKILDTVLASRRVPAKMMTDLDFADDISLLSDTVEKACTLLSEVERHCNRNRLGINAKKTKIMP